MKQRGLMVARRFPLESEPVAGPVTHHESLVRHADYEAQASELARAREQLELRLRLLQVVARISTLIARSSDLTDALLEGLGMIGEAGRFSRCLLLKRHPALVSEQDDDYKVIAEWCAPGVRSHHDCGTGTIASQDASDFIQKLRHGETFWCRIDEVDGPLRPVFERMEIRATGCAPIMVEDELWGTLAFDDCVRDDPWDEAHVDALTAVANAISNALQTQHRAEKRAIERAEAAQERAAELAKSNTALRKSISRLADVPDVEAAMVEAISTAAEVIGSSGGALGLYLPEERGFRTVFQVLDGERVDLEGLSYHSRIYTLDEEPIQRAWEQFHSGDGVLWCSADSCYLSEDSRRVINEQGFSSSLLVALKRGTECIGYLGFFLRHSEGLSVGQRELLRAIADQISLMLELSRLARLSESAAVARERDAAAQQRAAELAKSNAALRHTIDALSKQTGLISFVDQVLRIVAEQLQSPVVEYWETLSQSEARLVLSCKDGKTYHGSDWPDDPRVHGVSMPPESAHSANSMEGESHFIVEDLAARENEQKTYSRLGLNLAQWCAEQGVRKYINLPLMKGLDTIGALVAYFPAERNISSSNVELALALAQQITLAVTVADLAASAASTAAARERAAAAQDRAAELERINTLLRSSSQDLAKAKTPQEIYDAFLLRAVHAMNGSSGGLLKRLSGTSHEFASLVQGGVCVPRDHWSEELILTESVDVTGRDLAGVIARVMGGDQVWVPVDDTLASWAPGAAEFHRKRGNLLAVLEPFFVEGEVAGYLGIAFPQLTPPTKTQRETLRALGHQASLALELDAMHRRVEEAIVTRERVTAAQERAAELAKANEALRIGVEQIAGMSETREIAEAFLIQAVRAVSANGGAILLHVPGTASAFSAEAVYEDHLLSANEIARHPYLGALAELSASNPMGLFASVLSGEFVMVRTSDMKAGFPEAYKYHSERGDRCIWQAPLQLNGRTIGYLGFAIESEDMPAPVSLETIRALCHQLVLALEMTRLADESKQTAILRERELAAQDKAAELSKANDAMSRTLGELAETSELSDFVRFALLEIARQAGAVAVHLFNYVAQTNQLRQIAVAREEQFYPQGRADDPPEFMEGFDAGITDGFRVLCEEEKGLIWQTTDSPNKLTWEFTKSWHERMHHAAHATIALRAGNRPIGLLGMAFNDRLELNESQRMLVVALSQQISLAMEITRLAEESKASAVLREREIVAQERAAELELANQALRKGIAGLGQLDDLSLFLGEMLKAAVTTAGAHSGGVVLLDRSGEAYRVHPLLHSHGGFEPPDTVLTSLFPLRLGVRGIFQDVVATGKAWMSMEVDSRMDPELIAFHKIEGNRSVVLIPMRAGDRLLGMLGLGFPTSEPRFDKEFSLLRSLADQMAMAVEMVRLSDEAKAAAIVREQEKAAREHAAELTRANEALRKGVDGLVRLENLDLFLREMLKAAVQTSGAQGGAVALLDEDEENYRFAALLLRDGSFAAGDSPLLRPIRVYPALNAYFTAMMHSADAWSLPPVDPLHAAETRAFHEAQQNRALRHIPMIVNERLIGWLGLGFADPEPELGRAHSLLRVLADQMTMAVEMLRVSEEAKSAAVAREHERAAQARAVELSRANEQLALRDRLLTASAKALEHLMSTRVFAQGVNEALRHIGEAAELSRVKVLLQDSSKSSDPVHTLLYEWWAEGLESQTSLGYVSFPDSSFQKELNLLRTEKRWWGRVEDWPEDIQPAFRTIGVCSVGIVPIYVQQEYVGLIAFDQSDAGRDWSEPEIDALTIAARGLGAALSQERIMGQLAREREKAAQERAAELVKANYALRSSVDDLVTQTTTDGILTSLLKQAIEISGASSGAILRRVEGSEFEYVTIYANGEIRSSQAILAAGTNSEMRLASRLDPTGHFASLANGEARWRDAADEALACHLPRSSAFHRGAGNQRIYDFPYKVAGTVFGYLGLAFNDHNPPSEVVQETIKALATQVGLALEFRRITEQVERAAILEERNKFARDLHDTLAQGFAGILMQLGAAEQISSVPRELQHYLTRIDELARTSLSEARRTVSELRTSCQVRDALPKRLTDLAARLGSSYGQVVHVSTTGLERSMPFEVEEELSSIAQESVTNALKHAEATEIKLELTFLERGVRLKIRDNGIGFSSEQRRKDGHFGLQSMQERSLRINATMTIISEKGFGTDILTLWKE